MLRLVEALPIARQVALGLAYAHEHGVIHRDIKPDNILVEAGGRALITDFGVAHLESSDLTRTGEVLGTPHFMSPEQVTGQALDGRSDLFSLGVVMYLMLSGQRPFRGDTISTICYQIVHASPQPKMSEMSLPPEVSGILSRLLAKGREDRFADGRAVATAIDRVIERIDSLSTQPVTMLLPRPVPVAEAPTRVFAPPPVVPPTSSVTYRQPPKKSGLLNAVVISALALLVFVVAAGVTSRMAKGSHHAKPGGETAKVAVPSREKEGESPREISPTLQGQGRPADRRPTTQTEPQRATTGAPHQEGPGAGGLKASQAGMARVAVEIMGPLVAGGYALLVDGTVKVRREIHGGQLSWDRSKKGFQNRETLEVPAGSHTLRFAVKPGNPGSTLLERDYPIVLKAGEALKLKVIVQARMGHISISEGEDSPGAGPEGAPGAGPSR